MTTKKLRILFLPKWYPNELEALDGNFIENYVKALLSSFHITVLFVHSKSKQKDTYQIEDKSTVSHKEVHIYFKKSESSFKPWNKLINAYRYRKAQFKGYDFLSQPEFDLSHVHVLSRTGFLALNLKKRKKTPFVISEHWSGYHSHVGEYKGFLKKLFTQHLVQRASAIHVVSSPLQRSMNIHQLHGDYHIIPNVVDTKLFQPLLPTKQSDKIEILFVGNLLQRPKRILDIIEAMAELSQERNDFRLSIYGEGPDENKCKSLIEKLSLQETVLLKGTRDRKEIAQIMAQSNFLILFSEFENQPCVINEAQACGIPVVVPDIEGIEERMRSELGILFKRNDTKAFISAIKQMLDTHQNYNSSVIRTFAEQEYSEESIASKFNTFYLTALKNSKL